MAIKIFKSYSEKEIKRIKPLVEKINGLEEEYKKLSNSELTNKTSEFKERLKKGETLDDILPEAFAVVREASKRVIGLRHFDVQLLGGIILHQGRIAEMKTGEGKTLVETLPAYLNALEERGVHIVTVNEYLAKRDSEWMGKIFKFLGLTVGLNINQMNSKQKRKAYECDIMYSTNNEIGFDYLRDNMEIYKEEMVQRELRYAIIDEVDSVLIDEARTPLIISGRPTKSTDLYKKTSDFVKTLSNFEVIREDAKDKEQAEQINKFDYVVDLKSRIATLTGQGAKKAEQYFGVDNLMDLENSQLVHNINQALQAYGIMKKDKDYIVKDGEVLIVDDSTGRIMYGRRYSNGLHQAIEAKEGVTIADESQTLATITFQNLFRNYDKLAGMTGTAMTEDKEFKEIYNLDVVEIPTNLAIKRNDETDTIYKNEKAKFNAIIEDIKRAHEKGQPVLVGTVSVEKSEKLSNMLKKIGLKHEVLNAKNHEKEAEIVAQAGKLGAITISTNMAGRGTDIMLGGNPEFYALEEMRRNGRTELEIEEARSFYDTDDEYILGLRKEYKDLEAKYKEEIKEEKQKVIDAGGLKIIGSERHDSRRIDNQLRGRSGRQGDPGETAFYLSLEDKLMHVFGGDIIRSFYNKVNLDENIPIKVGIIGKQLEMAQRKVEGINFQSRKNTLNYDDVLNAQREIIYSQRRSILDGDVDVNDSVKGMVEETVNAIVDAYSDEIVKNDAEGIAVFKQEIINTLAISDIESLEEEKKDVSKIKSEIIERAESILEEKRKEFGEEFTELERVLILRVVDDKWTEHLDNMEDLKNGIGLRGYAQKDPVVQYRIEGSNMFDEMIVDIKMQVTKLLMHVRGQDKAERTSNVTITFEGKEDEALENENIKGHAPKPQVEKHMPIVNKEAKVGRNEPCPCGSGKKYKKCHGKEK